MLSIGLSTEAQPRLGLTPCLSGPAEPVLPVLYGLLDTSDGPASLHTGRLYWLTAECLF